MPNAKKKILLVEDDPAIIDIYATMIKKAHFDVESLSLGQDVIKRLKNIQSGGEQAPDLVLLDLVLPDMNGMEILSAIRGSSVTKNIKVFVLSNQADAEARQASDVAPDEFIVKANVTPTQLLEIIKAQLT